MVGESKPHGDFVAVSPTPTPTLNIALTNATAVTVSAPRFDTYAIVERSIPQDHFVVYPTGLVLPVGGKR